ncbi:sensor histidine kinase [Paraburkholderia sp. DHOC27]|uniref:sensor histidine kinase n=1 Tax=Paraburkholderia sp. DHOC27 TaxID=2303330 RepID=UPI000E3E383F|nr:ATP-binding protein [Paraburkholderia sp. DHOC27]RFU47254.1 histidine kinase [Paraburkholderia sp. DHOC27]
METSVVVPINTHLTVTSVNTTPDLRGLGELSDGSPSADAARNAFTLGVTLEHPVTAQPAIHPQRGKASAASAAELENARLRARVRELSAALVEAQEAAAQHLARELHDSVGAELTATHFALANVETWLPADAPPQCKAALEVASRSLKLVAEATRQTVAELHAPSLEGGIVGALSQWTGDFAARTQLRTSFVCAADLRLTRLPSNAALAVFRVAQEALNNVAKHARASAADVRIETSRRHLTLIISDDGAGLAPRTRAKQGHFGLAGMRARCAAFHGSVQIGARGREHDGAETRGTTVRARFAWDAMLADAAGAERRFLFS